MSISPEDIRSALQGSLRIELEPTTGPDEDYPTVKVSLSFMGEVISSDSITIYPPSHSL